MDVDKVKLGVKLPSEYASSTHNHDGVYLPINGTAVNSEKLGGNLPSAFALAGHNHNDLYYTKDEIDEKFNKQKTTAPKVDIFEDDSCVACYTLDGHTNDLGGVYNCVWDGTAIYDIGKFGGAAKFDGTNQVINTSFNFGSTDPIFSLSMWVKRIGDVPANKGFWGIGGGYYNNGICNYWMNNPGDICIDLWGRTTLSTGQQYPLYEWVHVVWIKKAPTFTQETLTCFINGIEYPFSIVLRNNDSAVNLVNGLCFGNITANGEYYYSPNIIVDHVRLFNRVLTANEVQVLYREMP